MYLNVAKKEDLKKTKKQEAHMSLYCSLGKDLLSYCPLQDMLDFDWLGIEPNKTPGIFIGIKLNLHICNTIPGLA